MESVFLAELDGGPRRPHRHRVQHHPCCCTSGGDGQHAQVCNASQAGEMAEGPREAGERRGEGEGGQARGSYETRSDDVHLHATRLLQAGPKVLMTG